jgi:hypothetical protein
VLALVTLPWGWLVFGLPNVAAFVVGIYGLKETEKGERAGFGRAVGGTIVGGIGTIAGVMTLTALIMGA